MSDEISRATAARENGPARFADLLPASLPDGGTRARARETAGAMVTWCQVNGDVERAHTTGVAVVPPRGAARDPQLIVYVDSGAFVTDFNANREVYLARLDAAGMRFSEVSFKRSRYAAVSRETGSRLAASPARGTEKDLPPLPEEQRRRMDELCGTLPESLRATVSRAMSASLRSQLDKSS